MWFFKDQNTTPNDALRQNRRAAFLIGIGVIIIVCTTFFHFPPYRILIAAPTMPDKIFAQSIVLVMPRGLARQGVILNHPLTPEQAAQLPPMLQGLVSAYGGPVNFPKGVTMLAWKASQPADYTLTLWDSSALGDGAAIQAKIAEQQTQGYRVRLFAGYAGWSPLQLEMEMWVVKMWQIHQPAQATLRLDSLFDGSGAAWMTLRQQR